MNYLKFVYKTTNFYINQNKYKPEIDEQKNSHKISWTKYNKNTMCAIFIFISIWLFPKKKTLNKKPKNFQKKLTKTDIFKQKINTIIKPQTIKKTPGKQLFFWHRYWGERF